MTWPLIPQPFFRALVLRVALLWFVSHATLFSLRNELVPVSGAAVLIVAIVLLVWYQMRRKRELVFLANLGIAFRTCAIAIALQCIALEVALRSAIA